MNKWYVTIPVDPNWNAERLVNAINAVSRDRIGWNLFYSDPDEALDANRIAANNEFVQQEVLEVTFTPPKKELSVG